MINTGKTNEIAQGFKELIGHIDQDPDAKDLFSLDQGIECCAGILNPDTGITNRTESTQPSVGGDGKPAPQP